MNTALQQFQNEQFGNIRAIEIDGQPWFVGLDIAQSMGYSNGSKAIQAHVDNEDKKIALIPHSQNGRMVSKMLIINESGLYSLIIASKLPSAKNFKRWVTSEVLPSIRQHGAYIEAAKLKELLQDAEAGKQLYEKLANRALKQNTELVAICEEWQDRAQQLAPKAEYYDDVLRSPGLLPVSIIAKDYGMTAVAFNKLLHGLGIQYKVGGTWLLYQKHCGKGYTKTRTYHINEHECRIYTLWTQAGRRFLYGSLHENGILPLMESPQLSLPLTQ